ncbi:hypothetical protein [Pseudorhodobacter antarcticus]|jgi:hypothetical protein|uniref:hypothetical protein n=1 Tax=Pseudorhodobacter antarcticus TaxID=1077947 RepID=UPI00067AC3A9|nr:hypothetical protein [Pseudorhodobacter antarcticus]
MIRTVLSDFFQNARFSGLSQLLALIWQKLGLTRRSVAKNKSALVNRRIVLARVSVIETVKVRKGKAAGESLVFIEQS